jgi:tRNA(fMet)-specific endonuclease VapC
MATITTYLLDTNILVLLMRGKEAGIAIDSAFGLRRGMGRCVISVVTVGEMKSFARKRGWGSQKLADLDRLLGQLVQLNINHGSIIDAYAEIDSLSEQGGRQMGKNDLWIAATAKVSGATLLTTDGDFDHLAGTHIIRIKIEQLTGNQVA